MSDISIPGVTSNLQTDKMIEKLMELERVPMERLQDEADRMEEQKSVWRDVTRKLSNLRDTAKNLYGFDSPFQNRVASSADESVLTATATREAAFESMNIRVLQTAAADRFLSSSLPEDYTVPEGHYVFTLGEDEVSFNYGGGKLSDFASTLTRKGKDLVRGQVVKETADTYVLLIESLKEGSENRLGFGEAAERLALDSGILKETRAESRNVTYSVNRLERWSEPLDRELFTVQDESLRAESGAEAAIPIEPPLRSTTNLILEVEVRVHSTEEDEYVPPSPPPGPDVPEGGSISFQGVTVESASSRIDLPEWSPPEPPPRVDDMGVLFLQAGNEVVSLKDLQDTEAPQTIRIKLSDYVDSLDSLLIRNRNTHKTIELGPMRIYDPTVRGDYVPARPVSEAVDSRVEFEGIEIRRPGNTIDDLVPGVTLSLHDTSERPVELAIEPDREAAKEQIITFVGYYNQLLGQIQVLTSNDESIIDELSYYSDEERETAREQLGLYQGDSTLFQMKSRLQTIMMNSYPTIEGRDMALLSQIGISTNSGGFGGGLDTSKLRGYLEIDEDTLDAVLEENIPAVAQLFGRDTDGDLIVDSGAAYTTETYIKPFVETGGIISYKITSLDNRIDRTNRDIESYEDKLADKEQELRRQYGRMEGAIESLQSSSDAIENLNRSLGNGQQ